LQYILENEFLMVEMSSKGAELRSIVAKSDGYQYLWQGDPQFWRSRAPVLFPIIGHLNGGRYLYQGREYAMQRHGFASKMDFSPGAIGKSSITFCLSHDRATLSQYPFEFQLAVTYTLYERMLTTTYQVGNPGKQTLWFSIGGHPGFNCSLNPEGRKDCRLVFEKAETVKRLLNESGYLTGEEEPFLDGTNIIDIALLNFNGKTRVSALQGLRSEWVDLINRGNNKTVRVRFVVFPYLGIWSPSNQAPFLCIEPWYGITATAGVDDVLNQKQGIQGLKAGDCFSCSFDMEYA
jgi:galactose mutarotase-like enzyme